MGEEVVSTQGLVAEIEAACSNVAIERTCAKLVDEDSCPR